MIEMRNVNKFYGAFHVLADVSLTVAKGERVVKRRCMTNGEPG